MPGIEAVGIGGRERPAAESLELRMGDHTGDKELAEPATAVGCLDVDVAKVGVRRAIGHHQRKPGLLTGGCIQPKGSELAIER